ncbi:MAG: hypothetical protein EOL89_12285, partial [Actinobacteria bacterium]|nr:hypothetical protein [Actinomycetota bacterium]
MIQNLTITTTALPQGTVGQPYTVTLTGAGGTAPYTWEATGLPAGLTLTGDTITGTPTAAGTASTAITLTDSEALTDTTTLDLAIEDAVVITTTALPSGTVDQAYTASLTAIGGTAPYVWEVTGLPAGLTLAGDTITGTPTATGSNDIEITVTSGGLSDTIQLSLAVAQPLVITSTSLPPGVVGAEYAATLTTTGGVPPSSWTAAGLLPDGLTLAATGHITGVPTAVGSTTVTFTASDIEGRTATIDLDLDIADPLVITTSTLPPATVGDAYSTAVGATGGTSPYTWEIVNLPASLTAAGDTISGTPTTAGTSSVTVTVTDDRGRTTNAELDLVVSEQLSITTTSLPPGELGTAYTASLAASGGVTPYSWEASGLPDGLTISGNTIGGTPTVAGTSGVLITVTDSDGRTTNSTLELIVEDALVITTTALPAGTVGEPYTANLSAAGGTPPYTWDAAGLPTGLTIIGDTISGTPDAVGTTDVTITLTDDAGAATNSTMTLAVSAAGAGLTLLKTVKNDSGTPAESSNWTLRADGPGTAHDLSGAGGVARTEVAAGTYALSETGTVTGYTNGTTWTCVTAAGDPVTVTDNSVTLNAGDDVECSITNTAEAPHLTLVKNVVNAYGTPAPSSGWTLRADGPGTTHDLTGAGGVA